jgi:hypothetical protein
MDTHPPPGVDLREALYNDRRVGTGVGQPQRGAPAGKHAERLILAGGELKIDARLAGGRRIDASVPPSPHVPDAEQAMPICRLPGNTSSAGFLAGPTPTGVRRLLAGRGRRRPTRQFGGRDRGRPTRPQSGRA